jgi:hypothetical protein
MILPLPTTPIVLDIGEFPGWIIAGIAALGLWKSWRTERKLAGVAQDVAAVKHETNSMRTALEAAKLAEGNLAGRKELHAEQAITAAEQREAK